MHYFSIFFEKFNKPCVNFLRIWTKKQFAENFQQFYSENCLKCIILAYFSNQLTNYAFIFCAFGRKRQFIGKFWKFLFRKWLKMHYFSIFFEKVNKPWVNFRAFGGKTHCWEIFDENSIEKLNFYLFLGKVVAKNRAFGNSIIFLQQSFPVGGGGFNPPPLRTPLVPTKKPMYWDWIFWILSIKTGWPTSKFK